MMKFKQGNNRVRNYKTINQIFMENQLSLMWYKMKKLAIYEWIAFGLVFFGILFAILFFFNQPDFLDKYKTVAQRHIASDEYKSYFIRNGTIGDFIAGVAGTLFALAGFIMVYSTFKVQKAASEREKIESRFFELLKLHKENVNDSIYVDPIDVIKNLKGRETFSYIYDEVIDCFSELKPFFKNKKIEDICEEGYIKKIKILKSVNTNLVEKQLCRCEIAYSVVYFGYYLKDLENIKGLYTQFSSVYKKDFLKTIIMFLALKPLKSELLSNWEELINNFSVADFNTALTQYTNEGKIDPIPNSRIDFSNLDKLVKEQNEPFYRGHQEVLGHYFRHLFQTVKYINGQPILNFKEKYEFIKTLRAQISVREQYLIFFNTISFMGWAWEFDHIQNQDNEELLNKRLITKYNLIKNISSLTIADHVEINNYYPLIHYEFEKEPEGRKALEEKYK